MKTGLITITALIMVSSLAAPVKAEDFKPGEKLLKNNLCLSCNQSRENLELAQRTQKSRQKAKVQRRQPNIPSKKLNPQPRKIEKPDISTGSQGQNTAPKAKQKDQDTPKEKKPDTSPKKQKDQGASKGEHTGAPAKEKEKERKSQRVHYWWYDYPSSRWHNYLLSGWYYPSSPWNWEPYLQSYHVQIDAEDWLLDRDAGEYAKALAYYEQSLAIVREIRDRQREADILKSMGTVSEKLGQYARALEYYEQSLAIARELNNRQAEAEILQSIGTVHEKLGQ